jgi:hypothetical protein
MKESNVSIRYMLTKQERDERKAIVDNALGTLRLEGLQPSEDTRALLDRFIAGHMTFQELDDAIEKLLRLRQISMD